MTFKEKLLDLRSRAGLTQEQLAERAAIPISTLRNYEQGRTVERLNFNYVVRLAKALGATCEAFASCEDVTSEELPPPAAIDPPRPRAMGKRK